MKKTLIVLIFMKVFLSLPLWSDGVQRFKANPDQATLGTWDLAPQKMIAILDAGGEPLSRPEITVADNGTICAWDWKNKCCYLFSAAGKWLKTIAKQGEGPGEAKFRIHASFVGDKLVVVDIDRLHFFTQTGEYLFSTPNQYNQNEPHHFLDEHQFIASPSFDLTDGMGQIKRVNLQAKTTEIIKEVEVIKNFKRQTESPVVLVGLSPMMVTGYDPASQTLYYGVNDEYTIHTSDLKGNIQFSFSVDRPQRRISMEDKIKEVKIIDPANEPEGIAKRLSDKIAYYYKIIIQKGLIFVFEGNFGIHWQSQGMDIFDTNGTYLYHTEFKPEKGSHIYFSSQCIQLRDNFLYVIQEDDEGEVAIVQYKIKLPMAPPSKKRG